MNRRRRSPIFGFGAVEAEGYFGIGAEGSLRLYHDTETGQGMIVKAVQGGASLRTAATRSCSAIGAPTPLLLGWASDIRSLQVCLWFRYLSERLLWMLGLGGTSNG